MKRYSLKSAADRFDKAYADAYDPLEPLQSLNKLKGRIHDLYLEDLRHLNELIHKAENPLERAILWHCKEIERAEYESLEILRAIYDAEILAEKAGLKPPDTSFHYKMAANLSETAEKYRQILEDLHAKAENSPHFQTAVIGEKRSHDKFTPASYPQNVREALAVFNLSPPVDLKVVKSRYRKLAKRHHPDAHGKEKERKTKEFISLNEAYNVLCAFLKSGHRRSAGH